VEEGERVLRIVVVAGARPNFVKIAPLLAAFEARGGFRPLLVHTGQHYDETMSRVFFDELGIPRPDLNLEVGSGTHAAQTADIMTRFEPVLLRESPDLVIVVGDVNSTLACSVTAKKLHVGVAHVEAGLRSFDETMPEEINRKVTDAVSDLLFVSERSGLANLANEGVPAERVHFVGNVMIDTLLACRERARERAAPSALGLTPGEYVLLTLHRPANVDDPAVLDRILSAVERVAERAVVVFPAHPRTRAALAASGIGDRLAAGGRVRVTDPLGYLDFLGLLSDAMAVLTDSGGIQEETTVLDVPCLTLRENTERPVTVEQGTNELVGRDPERILSGFARILKGERRAAGAPELWDGRAARRIADTLASWEDRGTCRHT
jgi:UDP-N-acetylglucosamine 2-epimerase (non-hydrolysing)